MNTDLKIPNNPEEFYFTGFNDFLLDAIWDKTRLEETVYSKLDGRSYEHFKRLMIESSVWCLFQFGFVRVLPMEMGHYGRLHAYFWSWQAVKYKEVIKNALRVFKETFKLRRVEIIIPQEMKGLNKFVEKLGFNKEGVLSLYYRLDDDELIDGVIYSIIDQED